MRIAYSAQFTAHIFQILLILLSCRDDTLGAGDLAREAYTRGSTDNISLIIIDFNSSSPQSLKEFSTTKLWAHGKPQIICDNISLITIDFSSSSPQSLKEFLPVAPTTKLWAHGKRQIICDNISLIIIDFSSSSQQTLWEYVVLDAIVGPKLRAQRTH